MADTLPLPERLLAAAIIMSTVRLRHRGTWEFTRRMADIAAEDAADALYHGGGEHALRGAVAALEYAHGMGM